MVAAAARGCSNRRPSLNGSQSSPGARKSRTTFGFKRVECKGSGPVPPTSLDFWDDSLAHTVEQSDWNQLVGEAVCAPGINPM